jgi:hypothetical protein
LGVFANALFALVTITVIIWQVCVMKAQVRVMKWQGRTSARHERMQNQLIRLEIEHSGLQLLNDEGSQILKMARKLHLAAGCFHRTLSLQTVSCTSSQKCLSGSD